MYIYVCIYVYVFVVAKTHYCTTESTAESLHVCSAISTSPTAASFAPTAAPSCITVWRFKFFGITGKKHQRNTPQGWQHPRNVLQHILLHCAGQVQGKNINLADLIIVDS